MSKDTLGSSRKKSRFVLEVRYEPLLHTFDRRGEIAQAVFPSFQPKVKHWRIGNVAVKLADDLENPTRLIDITHASSRILYEDASTRQEFLDDSKKFTDKLHEEVFHGTPTKISRIGFRSICVFAHSSASDFSEVYESLRGRFMAEKLPWSLGFSDLSFTLTGDDARLFIGPVKMGEDWIKSSFTNPEANMPEFGIGLDIDVFIHSPTCSSKKQTHAVVKTLQEFLLKLEEETLSGMV